jgi:hypothetical protein
MIDRLSALPVLARMARRAPRALVAAVFALVMVAGLGAASAQSRVAVVGGDEAAVTAIAEALSEHDEIRVVPVSAPAIEDEATASALAIRFKLNAVVSVQSNGGTGTVVAYEGLDGFVLGRYEAKATAAKLPSALAAPLWKKLGAALGIAQAPPAGAKPPAGTKPLVPTGTKTADAGTKPTGTKVTDPKPTGTKVTDPKPTGTKVTDPKPTGDEPPPDETPPDDGDDPDDDPIRVGALDGPAGPDGGLQISRPSPRRDHGPSHLVVAAAFEPFYRRLRYRDDIRDAVLPHSLLVNAAKVSAVLRPIDHLELTGAAELSFGAQGEADTTSMKYDTKASEWSVGAGYGGKVGPLELMARAGYGRQYFRINDDPAGERVPDMSYRWVRVGGDAALRLSSRWRLDAGVALRYLLATGDLYSAAWFPRATGTGLDGGLGLRVRLASRVELFARFDVRHYFFGMNPLRGDALIVGGAVDTYLGASVGAAVATF